MEVLVMDWEFTLLNYIQNIKMYLLIIYAGLAATVSFDSGRPDANSR